MSKELSPAIHVARQNNLSIGCFAHIEVMHEAELREEVLQYMKCKDNNTVEHGRFLRELCSVSHERFNDERGAYDGTNYTYMYNGEVFYVEKSYSLFS